MTPRPVKINPLYSLKVQLIMGAVVLLAITLGSISYFLVVHEKHLLIAEIEKTTAFQGRNIALSSEKALLRSDPEFELFPRVKRILSKSENITSVVITDSQGLIQGDSELGNISTPYKFDEANYKKRSSPTLTADEVLYDHKESLVFKTPIRSVGKVIGHVHLTYSKSELNKSISRAITITIFCGMVAFGMGVFLALLMFQRISKPVDVLVKGVKRIGEGDFDTKIELRTKSELSVLADSFNDMASKIALTQEELISKERMEKELEIAHDIQSTLIPKEAYKTEGFEIGFYYRSAEHVGGDYVDVIPMDARNIALVMADVAGKGVPGLVVMAMLKVMVRALVNRNMSPKEVVRRLNTSLADNLKPKMFVTFFIAYLNLDATELTYSNAGHNPLLIYKHDKSGSDLHKMKGPPLGVFNDDAFNPLIAEYRLRLEPGDLVFQYTDGLNESTDPTGRQFDHENIVGVAERFANEGALALVQRMILFEEVFRKGAAQKDDITLLALSATEAAAVPKATVDS